MISAMQGRDTVFVHVSYLLYFVDFDFPVDRYCFGFSSRSIDITSTSAVSASWARRADMNVPFASLVLCIRFRVTHYIIRTSRSWKYGLCSLLR